MTNPRETALALAVVTTIADAASERKDQLRAQLLHELNTVGADAVRAELDGNRIARTSLIAPQSKVSVADEEGFTVWVIQNYPTEVITTTTVRPAFKEFFLKGLEIVGEDIIDPKTGEVVPCVRARQGAPYVSTKFESDGRAKILEALSNQTLTLDLTAETPALPAGSQA